MKEKRIKVDYFDFVTPLISVTGAIVFAALHQYGAALLFSFGSLVMFLAWVIIVVIWKGKAA